jgi:hypothetical protein
MQVLAFAIDGEESIDDGSVAQRDKKFSTSFLPASVSTLSG